MKSIHRRRYRLIACVRSYRTTAFVCSRLTTDKRLDRVERKIRFATPLRSHEQMRTNTYANTYLPDITGDRFTNRQILNVRRLRRPDDFQILPATGKIRLGHRQNVLVGARFFERSDKCFTMKNYQPDSACSANNNALSGVNGPGEQNTRIYLFSIG